MASGRRAQELAEMLLKLNEKLPAQTHTGCGGCASSSSSAQKYSGAAMDWIKQMYSRNPKAYMYGGIAVAAVLIAGVGYAVYKKKQNK